MDPRVYGVEFGAHGCIRPKNIHDCGFIIYVQMLRFGPVYFHKFALCSFIETKNDVSRLAESNARRQ